VELDQMATLIPFVNYRCFCKCPPAGNIGFLPFEPSRYRRDKCNSILVDELPESIFIPSFCPATVYLPDERENLVCRAFYSS